MARKQVKTGKIKKSTQGKPGEFTQKMTEGLQKELDALVPPISVRTERQRETEERRAVVGDEVPFQNPVEDKQAGESKEGEEKVRPPKKRVIPWGIVIGEND